MKKIIFVFVLAGLFGVGTNFASAANPSVLTTPPSATSSSITFNGVFMANGSQTTTMFEYSTNQNDLPVGQAGNGTIACQVTQLASVTSGSFTCTLATPTITVGTTYFFRAIALNTSGTAYGNTTIIQTDSNGGGGGGGGGGGNGGGNGGGGGGGLCIPNPEITSISPSSIAVGSGTTNIVITGNNFNSSSVPRFNGYLKTFTLNQNQITVTLTANDLISSGNANITITNGGCVSNGTTFPITSNGTNNGGSNGGSNSSSASVTTQNTTDVTNTSSTLNGLVNPNGYTTTAWFEYGMGNTLLNFSETPHLAQTIVNSSLPLSQTISNLVPNTTYYFRAVANNSYGTIRGNIQSFNTKALNGFITTVQATYQADTSARLNGVFINPNSYSTQGYFEYGTSSSLGSTTTTKDLGTYSSVNFSDSISNLNPGTIYYFRAVATNQGSIYKGNIVVFQTKGTGDATINADTNTGSTVTTTQSSVLKITTTTDNISVGGDIEYLVTFNNKNSINYENTKISVQLPKEIDFTESNFGKVNSDNIVELNAGIMVPNQLGSITIKGKVNSNASDKSVLVTTVVMTYNVAGSTNEKDEIAFVTNHIVTGTGLEANSLFGANFLPSTLIGWLALVLAILALAVVGRKLFSSYLVKAPATTGNANHIDNLPL